MVKLSTVWIETVTALACVVLLVQGLPQASSEYTHVVNLEVNNLLLYNIAIKGHSLI